MGQQQLTLMYTTCCLAGGFWLRQSSTKEDRLANLQTCAMTCGLDALRRSEQQHTVASVAASARARRAEKDGARALISAHSRRVLRI